MHVLVVRIIPGVSHSRGFRVLMMLINISALVELTSTGIQIQKKAT